MGVFRPPSYLLNMKKWIPSAKNPKNGHFVLLWAAPEIAGRRQRSAIGANHQSSIQLAQCTVD
jgi:hypothetical protein